MTTETQEARALRLLAVILKAAREIESAGRYIDCIESNRGYTDELEKHADSLYDLVEKELSGGAE